MRKEKKKGAKKVIDSYSFNAEDIKVKVEVVFGKDDYVPTYNLILPEISPATRIVLEDIKQDLITKLEINLAELSNLEKISDIKKEFKEKTALLLEKEFPSLQEKTRNLLSTYLLFHSIGLGEIEFLLNDNFLEEIVINNSKEPVWVYHKRHGWLKTNIAIDSENKIYNLASQIGRRVGRQITILNPLLDAHLITGDRVNATLFPISTRGNTITIRKFARTPWTITQFIENKTVSLEVAALLWLAIHYELSILIAGGTGSGKTSMLNVLAAFFPPNQRIISIEDTRELQLPSFLHWVPLVTRNPNPEGKGGVSMLDLLVNSLRMRPDRIIVGEVRRQKEAEVMFEAMHTGHSVYGTIHADTAEQTIVRLTNPPINIPKNMIPAISLIVVQFRNRRLNIRRTLEVAEVTEEGDINILYRWNPVSDEIKKANESNTLIRTLRMFTGFSNEEIKKELEIRKKVLQFMVKNKIKDIEEVSRIISDYYRDKKELLKRLRIKA